MSDVLYRDSKEAALAKVLAREFNRAKLELLGLIPGLEPWMFDVAPEFWADHQSALISGTSPLLATNYIAQAETFMAEFDFLGVDWALVNTAAVEWAKAYGYDLVTGLGATSRASLQKLIPSYFEQGWNQGQLRTSLTPTFGPLRAEMIARTEVTRAASEGEQGIARLLAEQGITMKPIWNTRNDEIVCTICGPRNNHEIANGEYPPAHPRCRCWVTHELISTI